VHILFLKHCKLGAAITAKKTTVLYISFINLTNASTTPTTTTTSSTTTTDRQTDIATSRAAIAAKNENLKIICKRCVSWPMKLCTE